MTDDLTQEELHRFKQFKLEELQHKELQGTSEKEGQISPVCLGVCCSIHARCARYKAADFATSNVVRIYFCPHKSLFLE